MDPHGTLLRGMLICWCCLFHYEPCKRTSLLHVPWLDRKKKNQTTTAFAFQGQKWLYEIFYSQCMSPGLLSFIISFLNAVTCTDFSCVRILKSCKNQEGLPRYLYRGFQCRQGIRLLPGRWLCFSQTCFFCQGYGSIRSSVSAWPLTLFFFFFIITYILNINVFSTVRWWLINGEKAL